MTFATFKQLDAINYEVNRKVTYETDLQQYGKIEYWEPAVKFGDCEDYVLTKRQKLLDLGIDPITIHIVYCTVNVDGKEEGHAVLLVAAEDSDYILDNRFDMVAKPTDQQFSDYTWISIQTGKTWHTLYFGPDSKT